MEPLVLLTYTAIGVAGLAGVAIIDTMLSSRGKDNGYERLRALAAELEAERAKLRGCEERLSVLEGQLDVYKRQEELWKEEKQQLLERIEKLQRQLEEKKRELNHLAKENKAALNLYEALSKGKIRIVDGDGNECRVLVDGSIICKDKLAYPEVG